MTAKEPFPEGKILRALMDNRWVYYKPGADTGVIYTHAQKKTHLAEHPGEDDIFVSGKGSGIAKILVEQHQVASFPQLYGWRSGAKGIPRAYLAPIAEALQLNNAEKLRLYCAALFGTTNPPQDIPFPDFDTADYRHASAGGLMAKTLSALCATSSKPNAIYATSEQFKEALQNGELVIKKWADVLTEAATKPDSLLEHFSLTQDREMGGILDGKVKQQIITAYSEFMAAVLEFFPLAEEQRLAIALKLLHDQRVGTNLVRPEAIFSPENLMRPEGLPKHQGEIISELRRACGIHKETGAVRFWYDIAQEAIANKNTQQLWAYDPFTIEKLGKKIGVKVQQALIQEHGVSATGEPSRFDKHLQKIAELFHLSDKWNEILLKAPRLLDLKKAEQVWQTRNKDGGEAGSITLDGYRDLLDALQPNAPSEKFVLDGLPDWMQEVPGGLEGLRIEEGQSQRPKIKR